MTSSYMYNIVLIDSRVPDIETLVRSLNAETIGIVFQYETDTYDSIIENIKSKLQLRDATNPTAETGDPQTQPPTTTRVRVNAIGIVQHNYKMPVYRFVASETESTLAGVIDADPLLETWKPFSIFIAGLASQYEITALDLMACALYSDANWKYVIDTLAIGLQIDIRASTDDTGSAAMGGDWFLESHTGVNLKNVYFTELIDTYRGVLGGISQHVLMITSAGTVYGIGLNENGQLGLGDNTTRTVPTSIPPSRFNNATIGAISAGYLHSLFLTTAGTVYATGYNLNGELGLGDYTSRNLPTLIPSSRFNNATIGAISAGYPYSLFLTTAGTVYATGSNLYGYLGLGLMTGTNVPTLIPPSSFNNATIVAVSAGFFHSLFLTSAGAVYATGYNSAGQLGLGDNTTRIVPTLIPSSNIVAISAGHSHSLFLTSAGAVYATGSNLYGRLGLGDNTNRNVPTLIPPSSFNNATIVTISAGLSHSLFLTTAGAVYATGSNSKGQLGLGDNTNRNVPTLIPPSSFNNATIVAILAGYEKSSFLTSAGAVLGGEELNIPKLISGTYVKIMDAVVFKTPTYIDNRVYFLRYNGQMYSTRPYDEPLTGRLRIAAGTNSFTIETWYYETANQKNSTIVDMGNYNYTFQIRNANVTNAQGLSFYNTGLPGGDWLYAENAVVPVTQWSHIAVTREGSTMTFYINGIVRQTFTNVTGSFSSSTDGIFGIGIQSPGPTGACTCNFMKEGSALYDLRLWSVARTASQIQMNRNRILPSNTSGLVVNYLFNESSGSLFGDRISGIYTGIVNYDSSRRSNALVPIPNIGLLINNSYSLTTYNSTPLNAITHFGDITYTDFSGVDLSGVNFGFSDLRGSNLTNTNFTNADLRDVIAYGATINGINLSRANIAGAKFSTPTTTSLNFDGNDDYVNLGIPTWANEIQFRQTMTIECWFKTTYASDQPKSYPSLVARSVSGGTSSASQFSLFMVGTSDPPNNGCVGLIITGSANISSLAISPLKYNDAKWHHVASTYSSTTGTLSLYVDGVLVRTAINTNIGATSITHTTPIPILIGSDAGQISGSTVLNFQGSIADVRIWNVTRSASEILNNYRRRLIGNETGLKGYWKLNQGYGFVYSVAVDSTSNRVFGTLTNFPNGGYNGWVQSPDLTFIPNIGILNLPTVLAPNSSYTFTDPSSNSLGEFVYSVNVNSASARITNGAAVNKTIYAIQGPITTPVLTTYDFPVLDNLSNWSMDINFTVTAGSGYGPFIGDMYNPINNRGWGLWIGPLQKLHWSWLEFAIDVPNITVSNTTGVQYALNVTQGNKTTITFTLTQLSNNTIQTGSINVSGYTMGRGPVTIGGWITQPSTVENIPGTISSITVSVPSNQRVLQTFSLYSSPVITTSQISLFDLASDSKDTNIIIGSPTFFAITFMLAAPSATIPTTPTLGGNAGYYDISENTFLVNGRPETSTIASNLLVKDVDAEYVLTQVGITPTPLYKFSIYLNSTNSKIYVRGINISTSATIALPNVNYAQTFAVSYILTTPISPDRLLGAYLFGPNMSLDGVYFDNSITPKPNLTDLSFVNLTLSNSSNSQLVVLEGWNFTRALLHGGIFNNITFRDCICNATDFSGSNLNSSSFAISYDSAPSATATPNTATLQNAKFTNARIDNLTIAGYNNSATVTANQMDVSGLDFSGSTINGLKTYFLNRTGGGPLRMANAYGGAAYTVLTDSLIGRFIAGPTMDLSGLTVGNAAFVGTNFAGANIYGTTLAATTMSGVRVSNGRLTYSSLTTTLPTNFKIVTPSLSSTTNSRQYTVTNSGTGAYVINGENNPTIVLTRGARYVFNISASGHPFWIKTAATIGTGDAYTSGVTNNGVSSGIGITTFIVPADAPNTLYYKCELHSSMGGTITISDEINTASTYLIGPSADLSGVDATSVVFTGANVSGADFTNAVFRNVVSGSLTTTPSAPTLPNAQYSIVNGYFVGPYVDLSGSYLFNQSLANTNLTGVNFTNSNLSGITSGGISSTATISGVTATVAPTLPTGYGLTGGYIIGPDMNFTGADLSGFDFTNVNLSGTIFTGANITYVKSGNTLSSPTTLLPILPDASYVFLNNYLLGPIVNLSSKDLSGMQFYGLSLSGSIFTSANFSYADISGTIIDGANFTGATFTRTQSRRIPQPTIAPTFTAGTAGGYVIRNGYLIGANVDLSNVDFTGLDLSNTVLTNANLVTATFTNTRSGGITFNSLTPPILPAKYNVVGGYLHGPRVDLSGANFASYDFSTPTNAVNWSAANLTNATFTNMKSGWITIDSVGNDASGPILSSPYVYNRLVSANPLGGFIIGPRVSLNGATLTDYDLRNVLDITSVDFSNAAITGIKTSGSLVATPGSSPIFTPGSGYVLYAAAGRIIGPGVDLSGVDLSGRYFGTSEQAIAAGSTDALSSTNFTNANLTRASLYGSTVTETNFTGATFYRTRTGGLTYTGFGAPTLPNPNEYTYVGTDAVTGSGGYIIGPGVDLSGTNLRGAAFVNANFNDVDMSGAVITESISDNVVYDASTALPFGYKFITNRERKNFIAGPNISLSGKVLDAAIIADVDLTNTNFTNAGSIATTFVRTRSGGITYTTGQPPIFQPGSGYQIRSGYLVGPSVDLSNITAETISAGNGMAYGGGLRGVDLSGTNLESASFAGSDMSGVDLSGTTLSYTDFNGANFINIKSGGRISFSSAPRLPSSSYSFVTNGYSEASPTSAFQRYIVGPGAKCANADFSGAIFNRVDLSGVDFTNANFTRVSSGIMRNYPIMSALPTGYTIVIGTNPGSANSQDPSYNNAMYFVGPNVVLTNAYLASATITDCNVSGVDFTGADFTNMASARITTSTINPAIMPDATYFIKIGYIFGPNVNLSGGDFTGLDLSGAILTGAKFTSANFTGANLDSANITNADLSGSILTGAKTTRVVYQGYNYGFDLYAQDPSLPKPYRYIYSTITGSGVIVGPYADLSGADLRGSNLGYSNVTGTNLTGANLVGVRSKNCVIDNEVQPLFSTGSGFKLVSGYLIGPYADLTRNDFTDQDFSGTNLTGVDFTNSKLLNIKSGNIVASPALPVFPDSTFSLRSGYIIGPGVDLSNSDLSGIDLSNVTITNANMINSGFVNIKTGGIKGTTPYLKPKYMLRNGYIIGDSVDLSGADLSGQSLANAYFTNTNITNAVFTNSILSAAKSGGNMRYNDATKSRMPAKYTIRGTYILGPSVDVSGGDFTGLDISNTFLSGANLTNAVFTNTRSGGIQVLSGDQPILFSDPDFYNSQYGYTYLNGYIVGPGVDLSGSDFSGVTISAVDISGVNMTNARLTSIRSSDIAGQLKPGALTAGYKVVARHFIGPGLDMSGYDFTNGDFSGADISGSDLTNAVFTNTLSGNVGGTPTSTKFTTTMDPVNIKYQLSLGYIVGPSVDLTNSDLSGVDVSGINLSGATIYNSKSGKVAHSPLTILPTNYGFIGDYIVGPNVNLSMVDFSGADLRYTNLTNVNFGSANLYNVKSGNITGIPAQLPLTFSFVSGFIIGPGTDLSGADLSGGNLGGCNINDADLTNASFYNVLSGGVQGTPRLPLTVPYRITTNGYIVGPSVNLNGANFVSINMQGLTLTNAIMTNVDFENAKFGGNVGVPRILTPPYIHVQTELSGGYVVGPRMDLSSANFTNANIATADLSGANLANAVFYRTRSGKMNPLGIPSALPVNYGIMSTTLSGGYLVGPNVDLTNANFTDSILSNRNITGALMEGINFSNTHIGGGGLVGPPAALSLVSGSGSGYRFIQSASGGGYIIGPNIDLSGANFANTYLPPTTNVVGVNLTNVNFTNARTEQLVGYAALDISTSTILTPPYRLIVSAHTGAYIIGPRVNIETADFTDTDISNTDLTGVNLSNAVFTNMLSGLLNVTEAESNPSLPSGPNGYRYVTTTASGGYIVGPAVNLTRANLAGSDLSYVNMYGCDVSLAILPSSLTYVRSGMLRNSPAVLPAPYLFIPNDASGAYIVGPYSDLSGANLEGSTITGADISGADFTNARLARLRSGGMVNAHPPAALPAPYLFILNDASGAYIVGPYSDLSGANLEGSTITGADISGADFTNARLRNIRSGGLSISGPPAKLPSTYSFVVSAVTAAGGYIIGTGVDISNAVLTGTDLSGIVFTDAIMHGAQLAGTSLVNARSGGIRGVPASLPIGYTFVNDNPSGGYIVGQRIDLSGADLTNCVLSGMDVSGANLTNAIMVNTRAGPALIGPPAAFPSSAYRYLVSGAIGGFIIGPSVDILGANLSGADLSGYNFIGANVTGTDFSGANLVNIRSGKTVGPPASLSFPYVFMTDNSAGGFIVGPRVDLTGADLTNCQFTGLDISGATFINAILTNVRSGGGMIGPPAANTLPAKYRYVEDATDGTGGYFVGPGVDLSGALLRNMPAGYLQGAYFTNTNITNAQLSGSGLFYVKSGGMVGAPASLPATYSYVVSASGGYIIGPYADLSGANLNNTVLTGMNIAHADFTRATFVGTRTGGLVGPPETLATNYYYIQASSPGTAAAQDAYIVGPRVNLARAVLSRTNLKNVDLSGADFTNAVFEGTNFTNTNIRNAVLTGVAPFTNTQRLQLLKNSNNRNNVAAQVAQCLGGEIDIIAATSNRPNTHTYSPIFDYIRDQPVDVLTVDNNGNSNLSLYDGRSFYIPSAPGESFYVDATATVSPTAASSFTQYYYDEGRDSVIETLTGNTIRSVGIGGGGIGSGSIPGSVQRVFMVFGGSVMGLVIDDVYNALGFPPIFKLYAYYGVRNLTLPSQISPVNTVIGNGQISLNWTASFSDGKPRLGYSIEYTTQEPVGNIYVPWTVYSPQYALTNATITGLTNGTAYYFRVAAINIVDRGPYTVVQAVPGAVPDPIVNMFVNGSDNALTLEWTDPYNQGYAITEYSIRYRAITASVSVAEFTTLSIPVSDIIVSSNILMDGVSAMRSYQLPIPIQNGTPYEVQIAAVNAVGRGAYRGSLGQDLDTVTASIAGTAPGGVDAANIVCTLVVSGGGGKVRLSWYPPTSSGSAPIYAYGIQLYATTTTTTSGGSGAETTPADTWTWKTVSQTAYTVIPDTDTGRENALCAVITGLVNGSGYRFRIAAISGVGRGTYSNAVPSPTASAIIAGSTPAVLTTVQMGYTIDTVTGGKITLAWAKPKSNGYAVSAYKVRTRPLLYPTAWVETPVIEVPSSAQVTLVYRRREFNTGLINGTEYEFQVAARNQLGWSEFSETLIGVPRSVPDAPAVITATSLDTSARVEWSGGNNTGGYPITGYQVQYKLSTSLTWSEPINIEGVYNTSTIISNLVNGRSYMVRAFRKNAIGYSPPTSSASVVPGVRAAPPIGLFFSVGPNRITLYWKPPIDTGTNQVLYYYVQYKVATAPETSYEYLKDTPQSDPKEVTSTTIEYDAANTLYYTAGIEGANLLTNGTQYSVRVAAATMVGIGAYSDPILAIPGTVPAQVS